AKIRLVFSHIGYDVAFGRKEVAEIIGISQTAAGNLINKLKVSGMVEPVSGLGKGKYKFKK
ncbi:MAG TPA: AAA family ATPase, partial [Candidatus Eisenbergiella intestinigallinarum]|nr:AAA family ATPase [Candidatus Eisenbergiella intestinigallinarum]